MIARRVDPDLTARARDLRTHPTRQERTLWRLLSRYSAMLSAMEAAP